MQEAQPEALPEFEEAAEAVELIEISHGPDGTSVRIEDPTWMEITALAIVGVMVLAGIAFKFRER